MKFELSLIFETLFTKKTRESLLTGVKLHVRLQVSFKCKTLPTLLAGERFLSSVNSHIKNPAISFQNEFANEI